MKEVLKKAMGMTAEERLQMCDFGYYNDVIKGYLIEAMRNADFSEDEIQRALSGLDTALDETTAAGAAETYRRS